MGFWKKVYDNPKWYTELLFKQRKQSCADHSYLQHNGSWEKAFDTLLKLIGNKYNGPNR